MEEFGLKEDDIPKHLQKNAVVAPNWKNHVE